VSIKEDPNGEAWRAIIYGEPRVEDRHHL
jgi:hypothetical protein